MANTLYAAFEDATMAEKAAGALLDHGVRAEDLSLVQNESRKDLPTTVEEDTGYVQPDIEGSATGIPLTGVETDNPLDHGPSASSLGGIAPVSGLTRGGTAGPTGIHERGGYNSAYADSRPGEGDLAEAGDVERETVERKSTGDPEATAKHGITTTTAADAGSGAVKGAAFGLGVGAAAAMAALFIPGIGFVVGGGALAAALGGLAATTGAGAAVGALTGYLKDQGVDEHVAHRYGEAVIGGGAVLAIHLPSGDVDEAEARSLLAKYGATNVNAYALTTDRPYMA